MKCMKEECCDVCIYHTLVSKGVIETGKLKVLCTNAMSKNCGKEFEIFGKSKLDETAKEFGIPLVAKLPIDPEMAQACDQGKIEAFKTDALDKLLDGLEKI